MALTSPLRVRLKLPDNFRHREALVALLRAIPAVEPSRARLRPLTVPQATEQLCSLLDTRQWPEAVALARMMTASAPWERLCTTREPVGAPIRQRLQTVCEQRYQRQAEHARHIQTLRKQIFAAMNQGQDVRALAWEEDQRSFQVHFWSVFEEAETQAMKQVAYRAPACVHLMHLIAREAKMAQPAVGTLLTAALKDLPPPFAGLTS